MSLSALLAFNLALLAAIASPGPALLTLMHTSMAEGRIQGILTGIGLGFVASAWTLAALLGLDGLFRLFPWAYAAIKVIGALYLIYLAIQTWRNASNPPVTREYGQAKALQRGLLVNLANPKAVLFAAAVIAVIFPGGLAAGEMVFIVANHFVVEVIIYSSIAALLSREMIAQRYVSAKPLLDRVTAGVLCALGGRLLIER